MCESRSGRPGLPVPSSPYDICGRKATFKEDKPLSCLATSQEPSQISSTTVRGCTGTAMMMRGLMSSDVAPAM